MSVDVEAGLESSASELTRVEWAPVPRVNLLPPEILAARRFRRLQRQLAGIVLSVLLLGAAAGAWAQSGVLAARSDLAQVQAQTQGLMQQRARYAEVPKALAELDAARAAREGALRSDVLWYQFLGDLAVNTPAGTELTTVSVVMSPPAASGTGASTSASAGTATTGTLTRLGEVKVTGRALRFRDVATWLETVTQVHGLAGSNLQSVARDESSSAAGSSAATSTSTSADVSYTGSAIVTSAGLSHRYDRKAG